MFDQSRAKQLQQKSHVRGMLSKEFYSLQQMELQKKRRQMKNILDQQVEERRRKKQQEKMEQQKKIKKEQEQIRHYYAQLQERQKKNPSIVQTFNPHQNSHSKANLQPLALDPNQSRVRQYYQQSIQNIRQRVSSKSTLADIDGDIPLLPVMALSDNTHSQQNYNSNGGNFNQNYNFQKKSSGNIPLLDLGDEGYGNHIKIKKKSKAPTKRQKTTQRQNHHLNHMQNINEPKSLSNQSFGGNQSNSYQSFANQQPYSPPSHQYIHEKVMKNSLQNKEQRRKTFADQQIGGPLANYNQFQNNKASRGQHHEVTFKSSHSKQKRSTQYFSEEFQQYENQNKQLKNQLKKSQEAISLLIGAVRSNAKLDKFRIQAERILHSQNESMVKQQKESREKIEQQLMLPKLTLKHQSIMHDYMLNAAKRGHKLRAGKH